MAGDPRPYGTSRQGGVIPLFVRHPTAANLLMAVMLVLGLFGTTRLQTQFFPTIEVPIIVVEVDWAGATAEDVESQVLETLEPELRFLDGVVTTRGMAREGSAFVTLEFDANEDMARALSETERAVSGVTTLPEDAGSPQIRRITFFEPVTKIAITGPFDESALKHYARHLRDGLLAAGVEQVELVGLRGEEIEILITEATQRELDLTVADVADRVRAGVQNIPVGTIEGAREVQIRSLERRQTREEIGAIEVRATSTGEKILVRDLAVLRDDFDRNDPSGQIAGHPAIELRVKRALAADTLETQAIVDDYISRIRPELPPTLELYQYDATGKTVSQRIGVLLENGAFGLVLVLLTLTLFLSFRVAFWVAAGIPIALLGTLGVMWLSGQSINMVSVFALIMMIGIIVDDGIVVGEEIATLNDQGIAPDIAAVAGARSMLTPVMAATLTTAAAFLPIVAVSGPIGQVMQVIPFVVIAVLIASTLECFLVLPTHVAHAPGGRREPPRFRRVIDGGFMRFRDGPYRRLLEAVVAWRYAYVALLLGVLIILVGTIAGQRLKYHFFLSPEAEVVRASVVFAPGLPLSEQTAALEKIEAALDDTEISLTEAPDSLVNASFTLVGAYEVFEQIRLQNVAQIEIELTASENRKIPTDAFVAAWQAAIPPIPGVMRIAVSPVDQALPDRAIEILLQDAPIEVLKAAAVELAAELERFDGVNAVLDNLPYGRQELVLHLTPEGHALGFTMAEIGRQLRNQVEGATADRFVRNEEVVEIVVRRDASADQTDVALLQVLSRDGRWVPLIDVATLEETDSFAIVRRVEGKRTVTVSADVDTRVTSTGRVVAELETAFLPNLAERYGVSTSFGGRTQEREVSFADFRFGLGLAGAFIYVILALALGSYARPVFVMAIIPFGMLGAVTGHLLMGMDLTVVSLIGLLGLTGVLVNDSIILIDRAGRRIAAGESIRDAAIAASQDRLRAILLTSITTIAGLLPLLFETSRQAQFLIPLAVTFIFGLALTTLIVPLLIPAMFGIREDFGRLLRGDAVGEPDSDASAPQAALFSTSRRFSE